MSNSWRMTLNRRAGRAVALFDGSAVPARRKIGKANRSRRRPERDSILCGIAKHKDTFFDVASRGRGTAPGSAPRLYFGRAA